MKNREEVLQAKKRRRRGELERKHIKREREVKPEQPRVFSK